MSSMSSFTSDQNKDSFITFAEERRAYIRFLYARARDSRLHGGEGQDYLAWRYMGNVLAFVICDGVSGSFFGNLAAKFLGSKLLDFLLDSESWLDTVQDASGLRNKVKECLNAWREEGQREIEKVTLPDTMPPLQKEALEEIKEQHGSETVFIGGRLSFDKTLEQETGRLTLIWMGNAQARVYGPDGRQIEITGGRWHDSDRWSTKHGIKNQVHVWLQEGVSRVIAFSDGFVAPDNIDTLPDHQLQERVGIHLLSPNSDDISFIDIRLKVDVQDGVSAPQDLHQQDDGKIVWSGVEGADQYEIQETTSWVSWQGTPNSTQGTEWPLKHGEGEVKPYLHYRVRACVGERKSRWSHALTLKSELSPPSHVRIQPVEDEPGSYIISWDEVIGAQYYAVAEECEPVGKREVYLGSECQCKIRPHRPETQYRVRAYGPAGQSNDSQEVSPLETIVEQCESGNAALSESEKNPQSQMAISAVLEPTSPDKKLEKAERAPGMNFESSQCATEVSVQARRGASLPGPPYLRVRDPSTKHIRRTDNYEVFWDPVPGAEKYVLYEADNSSFKGEEQVYLGPDTRILFQKKPPGTFWYRAFSCNGQGHFDRNKPSNTVKQEVIPIRSAVFDQLDTSQS
jgi:hypothetical protein